jgi:hypothetical protein
MAKGWLVGTVPSLQPMEGNSQQKDVQQREKPYFFDVIQTNGDDIDHNPVKPAFNPELC